MTFGLESTFKIVFSTSRLLGFAPMRFSDTPRVSKVLVIYGGVLLFLTSYVFWNYCGILITELFNTEGEVNNKVKNSLFRLLQLLDHYVIYVYAIMKSVPRTKLLLKIVNDLKKYSPKHSRKSKGMPKERNTIYYFLLAMSFLCFVGRILKYLIDAYNPGKGMFWNVQILFALTVFRTSNDLILLQFVVVALLVHSVLEEFNRKLKHLFSTKKPTTNKMSILYTNYSTKRITVSAKDISSTIDSLGTLTNPLGIDFGNIDDVNAIKNITNIYICYCNFVRELNACESILLMTHVYKSAMHLIATLLLMVSSILSFFDTVSSQFSDISYCSFMTIFYGMLLFLLVEPSYRAQTEIKQTYLLVGKELNQALDRNDIIELAELRALLKQLHLNQPFYSGFGLCMLERPLLMTVVSAVATSLVLMFQ